MRLVSYARSTVVVTGTLHLAMQASAGKLPKCATDCIKPGVCTKQDFCASSCLQACILPSGSDADSKAGCSSAADQELLLQACHDVSSVDGAVPGSAGTYEEGGSTVTVTPSPPIPIQPSMYDDDGSHDSGIVDDDEVPTSSVTRPAQATRTSGTTPEDNGVGNLTLPVRAGFFVVFMTILCTLAV